jgi:hypothetical protein
MSEPVEEKKTSAGLLDHGMGHWPMRFIGALTYFLSKIDGHD